MTAGVATGFAGDAGFWAGGTIVCSAEGAGAGFAGAAGFVLGGAIACALAGARPPPFIAKPHFGQSNWAAVCKSAALKSCEHVGFGHGIVFAIFAETFEVSG